MMYETKESIKHGRMSDDKFHLQGVHTYDILRNPHYYQAGVLVLRSKPGLAGLDGRKDYIIDGDDDDKNDCAQSDLVRIVLNLAFLSHDEIMQITFD